MDNFFIPPAGKYQSLQLYADNNPLNHTQLLLGIDCFSQKKVMIKRLLNGYTSTQFGHFFQEYQVYQQLNNLTEQEKRYFLTLVDVGEADNYLAFKWEQGVTLKSLIANQMLSFTQKIAYLIELCTAVEILHSQGIIHCDIKPSNILICHNQVKLLDFGLSQPMDNIQPCVTLTAGTPAYMSPEQFLGQAVGRASDYYNVGVVMYELLQGKKPFFAITLAEWAIAHCQLPIPTLQLACQQDSLMPTDLERLTGLIKWLMAKLPENRPISLQPIITQLRNWSINLFPNLSPHNKIEQTN